MNICSVRYSGVAALVCLAFDLFMFLHRRPTETIRTVRLKEGAFAFACAVWLAVLIPATVVNATRSGYVTKPGASPQVIAGIVALSGEDLRCEFFELAAFLDVADGFQTVLSEQSFRTPLSDGSHSSRRSSSTSAPHNLLRVELTRECSLILVSIAARHTLKHGQPRLDSESHDVNSPALSQAGNNLLPSNSLHNTSAEKRHAASPGLGMDGRQEKMEL